MTRPKFRTPHSSPHTQKVPPFLIRPWDRPRPRLHPPLADFSIQHNSKTFFGRHQHGLTFLRESGKNDDWLLAFNPDNSGDFADELRRGRIARYVLLPFQAETWRREFPLFLRPDGSGWLRESWNREDVKFQHNLSMHDWLESPASEIFPFASELFKREIAPQLEAMNWPKGRDVAFDSASVERAQLQEIVRHALALEGAVENSGKIVRATFQTESPFYRAGCFTVQAERGEIETWFDESNGERVREPWKRPTLRLSNRFWDLCDLAVDVITPLGHYFDYTDKGAGRLSESPIAREFSLQFIAKRLPSQKEARSWLSDWLGSIGADSAVLDDDSIADFEERSRD